MRTFDLFRQFGPRKALWLNDFERLEDAESAMRKIAAREPGAYFIYDEDAATAVSRLDSDKLNRSANSTILPTLANS